MPGWIQGTRKRVTPHCAVSTMRSSWSRRGREGCEVAHQFSVSGEIVLRLFLCFCHVLQLAFSSRTPFAISCLCLVIDLQLAQTSSSDQSWER